MPRLIGEQLIMSHGRKRARVSPQPFHRRTQSTVISNDAKEAQFTEVDLDASETSLNHSPIRPEKLYHSMSKEEIRRSLYEEQLTKEGSGGYLDLEKITQKADRMWDLVKKSEDENHMKSAENVTIDSEHSEHNSKNFKGGSIKKFGGRRHSEEGKGDNKQAHLKRNKTPIDREEFYHLKFQMMFLEARLFENDSSSSSDEHEVANESFSEKKIRLVPCIKSLSSTKVARYISDVHLKCCSVNLDVMEVLRVAKLKRSVREKGKAKKQHTFDFGPLIFIYEYVIELEIQHSMRNKGKNARKKDQDKIQHKISVFFYDDYARTLADLLEKQSDRKYYVSLHRVSAKSILPQNSSTVDDDTIYCLAIGGTSVLQTKDEKEFIRFDDGVEISLLVVYDEQKSITSGRGYSVYTINSSNATNLSVTHHDSDTDSSKKLPEILSRYLNCKPKFQKTPSSNEAPTESNAIIIDSPFLRKRNLISLAEARNPDKSYSYTPLVSDQSRSF